MRGKKWNRKKEKGKEREKGREEKIEERGAGSRKDRSG